MLGKNREITLKIDAVSSDGNGVGRVDGFAVFVPASVDGDLLRVKVVKAARRYAFGRIVEILEPSPHRIVSDCPVFGVCGGCAFRHMDYRHECAVKRSFVSDALRRIGGFSGAVVRETLPSPLTERYRNKVQLPVVSENGALRAGFYARRSHRVVPFSGGCLLEPESLGAIAGFACKLLSAYHLTAYNEREHSGLVRHILLRQSHKSGAVMLCLVLNGDGFPGETDFARKMTDAFPQISGILLNQNRRDTNVILGEIIRVIAGDAYLYDALGGADLRLSVKSFFQINHGAAERLYGKIAEYAVPEPGGRLLDLYCGAGSIGLSLAGHVSGLTGVEILPEAVDDARWGARANRIANAVFFASDASDAAARLAAERKQADIVVTDPPRRGCDQKTIEAIRKLSPPRVVMVSCNSATLARDLRLLADGGYTLTEATPVDMFPRTQHIECAALMEKKP